MKRDAPKKRSCGWDHVPNDETAQALRDARDGKDLVTYASVEEMFDDLGIQSPTVRLSADEIPEPSPEEVARLEAAMDLPIDTSDIPETKGLGQQLTRDASGRPRKRYPNP
jgi:hypothetical protein